MAAKSKSRYLWWGVAFIVGLLLLAWYVLPLIMTGTGISSGSSGSSKKLSQPAPEPDPGQPQALADVVWTDADGNAFITAEPGWLGSEPSWGERQLDKASDWLWGNA